MLAALRSSPRPSCCRQRLLCRGQRHIRSGFGRSLAPPNYSRTLSVDHTLSVPPSGSSALKSGAVIGATANAITVANSTASVAYFYGFTIATTGSGNGGMAYGAAGGSSLVLRKLHVQSGRRAAASGASACPRRAPPSHGRTAPPSMPNVSLSPWVDQWSVRLGRTRLPPFRPHAGRRRPGRPLLP